MSITVREVENPNADQGPLPQSFQFDPLHPAHATALDKGELTIIMLKFLMHWAALVILISTTKVAGRRTRDSVRGQRQLRLTHISHANPQTIQNALSYRAGRIADNRDLKDGSTPAGDLVEFACETITALLPGSARCDCSMSLSVTYDCVFDEEICVGGIDGFCATPLVTGTLGLLDSTVGFEFCTASATSNGVSVPGLCVSFANAPLDDDGKDSHDKNVGRNKPLTTCSASLGGIACSACELCADGNGYTFDCSAHQMGVIQSECTAVSVIDSLTQDHVVAFFPNLDV